MKRMTVLGLGAACAACCAAPIILTWIIGVGGFGLAGQFGAMLTIALVGLAIFGFLVYRKRKSVCASQDPDCGAISCSPKRSGS
jgi:hypothetical protein